MNSTKNVVLLVEDNESHYVLIERGMSQSQMEFNLIRVQDGEEALEYLRNIYDPENSNPKPKLILMDLRLPRMDGLDVLKTIKKSDELWDIPVVVLTSSMAEPDIVRAYHYHANGYLVKHIDYSDFKEQITDTVKYWLKWNITPLQ